MTAQLIDGKAIAANVRQRVAEKITARQQAGARAPGLAVVVVGEDPASHVYVSNKHRACEQAGILSFQHALPADTTQEALEAFQWLSEKEGILPALESAHALAYLRQKDHGIEKGEHVVLCLSGRGDKDVYTVAEVLGINL